MRRIAERYEAYQRKGLESVISSRYCSVAVRCSVTKNNSVSLLVLYTADYYEVAERITLGGVMASAVYTQDAAFLN